MATVGRGADQYTVRMPEGLRDRIKAAAADNGRSMNAEIVSTLEDKYPPKHVLLDMLEFFLEGYKSKLKMAISNNDLEAAERCRLVIETLKRDIENFPH